MSHNMQSLMKRLQKVEVKLDPPERETRLPYLVMDFDTGEDMSGYEAHNQEHRMIARRLRCHPHVYGFDPNEEGSEP